MVETRLELIAALAKQLALDYKNGRLWDGELTKSLNELSKQIDLARSESRDSGYGSR